MSSNSSGFNDVISKIIAVYDDFLNNILSLDQFYNDHLMPFLKSCRDYRDILGDNAKSLDLFLINIKDKYDAYKQKNDLGIEVEARNEKQKAMLIASEIIQKLIYIRNQLLVNNSTADNVVIDERKIALENEEDLTLKENDWNKLLNSIKKGNCLPFIGTEPFSPWIPLEIKNSKDWTKFLSEKWTEEYGYPFADSSQLSRVAQFIAFDRGDLMYPKEMLSDLCTKIEPPDFSQKQFDENPYSVLADLDLPIYITTNFDHFMEYALQKRNSKKIPVGEVCRWSDSVKKWLRMAGNESIFSEDSKYKPEPDKPLVYHLHGDMDIPQSLVLTEKDYIDFIKNLSLEGERGILPFSITRKLATSSLLFVGYDLEEINFRIILQCVLGLQVDDLRETSIAVQLRPKVSSDKEKKAINYLREYMKGMNVRVYWGDSFDFCKELRKRLVAK